MNNSWKKAILDCYEFLGEEMTKAIIYAAKNKSNIRSYNSITIPIKDGNIKCNSFSIQMEKNVPITFNTVLDNLDKPLIEAISFNGIYEQQVRIEEDDGVYAAATLTSEYFVFSFKLEYENEHAVLLGVFEPIFYYGKNQDKLCYIQMEVFDCFEDIKEKYLKSSNKNKKLLEKLIEEQQLNSFLTNTNTKHNYNWVQYESGMSLINIKASKSSKIKK